MFQNVDQHFQWVNLCQTSHNILLPEPAGNSSGNMCDNNIYNTVNILGLIITNRLDDNDILTISDKGILFSSFR